MRPLSRHGVNKYRSAGSFRGNVGMTAAVNMIRPMRGGWRL